eukprot:scaffold45460_cov67-Phaeocystis_antarctica.AAC.8
MLDRHWNRPRQPRWRHAHRARRRHPLRCDAVVPEGAGGVCPCGRGEGEAGTTKRQRHATARRSVRHGGVRQRR